MKTLLIFCLSGLIVATTYAQQSRQQRLDSLYKDPFLYPTVSAVLLPRGFLEINTVAALLTADRLFTDQARPEALNARVSNISTLLQLTYGASPTSRFNVGADLLYGAYRVDIDPGSSPWKVWSSDSALARDGGLTTAGLRVRWQPQARNRRFVLQGSLYQPIRRIASSQVTARLQAVYVFELSRRLYLFAQGSVVYALPKRPIAAAVTVPVVALLQYQFRPALGLLGVAGNTVTITLPDDNAKSQTAFGAQVGVGAQYQPSLGFGVTGFYTRYVLGRNNNAYNTLNIGIRFII